MPDVSLPTDAVLSEALGTVLQTGVVPVRVLKRSAVYGGSFPSEFVECRVGSARPVRLFCKYGADVGNTVHGHRGGPAYECAVYENLLSRSRCTLPPFRGSFLEPTTRQMWLFLTELRGCYRIHQSPDPEQAMVRAARWIGRFHAEQTDRLVDSSHAALRRYDLGYYRGWARRTRRFIRPRAREFPWIDPVCRAFESLARELTDAPLTVIHGEFYPKNILIHGGRIRPVDWESTAVGPGEIDLAALGEAWPLGIVRTLEDEYRRARWPRGSDPHFEWRLKLARLYMCLRWVGDNAEWTLSSRGHWYLRQIRKLGRQLGVLR